MLVRIQLQAPNALVMESEDMPALEAGGESRESSSLSWGTMVGVAKWLTHLAVNQAYEGSIPSAHPIK